MNFLNVIADLAVTTLQSAGVTGQIERSRFTPHNAQHYPLILVYCRKDVGNTPGSARVHTPQFNHTTTLAISVFEIGDSGSAIETSLLARGQSIADALLTNRDFVDTFEGVSAMRTDIVVPDDAEELIAQLVLEFDLLHATDFIPVMPVDDFTEMRVDAQNKPDAPKPGARITPPQS